MLKKREARFNKIDMDEQCFDVSPGKRIETHNAPLVVERLRAQIKNSPICQGEAPMEQRVAAVRERLRGREPYFMLHTYSESREEGFQMVPLNKIVGGVSSSFDSWGHEYDARRGRHLEIITELVDAAAVEGDQAIHDALNHVFHLDDGRSTERISLIKVRGPAGDVYFVSDGTHRLSVCKALELDSVPAEVASARIGEVYSTDATDRTWWGLLIEAGLVQGEVVENSLQTGPDAFKKLYSLKVEQAVVPWLNYTFREFFQFNRRYNEIYPGAFSHLTDATENRNLLPENVFLDIEAFDEYRRARTQSRSQ